MNRIILSRFDRGARAYTHIDGYWGTLDKESNWYLPPHMDGLIDMLHADPNEPTGWSFAEWNGKSNHATNIKAAHALVLEYGVDREDTEIVSRLSDKARALGWTFFMVSAETRTRNTIALVFPLAKGIYHKQYARLASIRAAQLDEYGLEHGSLAATHIINVHRTSVVVYEPGIPMDPELEIKRTAKLYQRLDALKYEGTRPAAASVNSNPVTKDTVTDVTHEGLFAWSLTDAEKAQREAEAIMLKHGLQVYQPDQPNSSYASTDK